jgi:glc operon protein GlcG
MFPQSFRKFLLGVVFVACAGAVPARAQMPNAYGMPISLEDAKKVAAPALAEARKNNWLMAVAIVDPSGNLIYFEKMDNTQLAASDIAVAKARAAAVLKRPTKALQDALAAGGDGLRILGLPDSVPVEGGIPLLIDGKIVGAIGVSGQASSQDAQCAQAGANALK